MNAEQLNAIKERAAKATPGPWYSHADGTIFLEHTKEIADVWTDNEKSDATFIAHAREDVPALVAEVERLQQETEYLKHSLLYIAERRESNRDWKIAHNALAVYGRPKGAY